MKYKRVMLKLSGESLKGNKESGIDFERVLEIAKQIKIAKDSGTQIAIVVGGGNFWRGRSNTMMDSCTSDHIGMLATTMNALALNDALIQVGVESRVQTGIEMRQMAEFYIRGRAIKHLDKGRVVIFACGTGSPFFSTDTAAALRAAEIKAEVFFKATNVEGVYDSDPNKNKDAKKIDKLTYLDLLNKGLNVMDTTASTLCMNNNIKTVVFNMNKEGNIEKAINGENIGTIIE